jgi:hypothetical protein
MNKAAILNRAVMAPDCLWALSVVATIGDSSANLNHA